MTVTAVRREPELVKVARLFDQPPTVDGCPICFAARDRLCSFTDDDYDPATRALDPLRVCSATRRGVAIPMHVERFMLYLWRHRHGLERTDQ